MDRAAANGDRTGELVWDASPPAGEDDDAGESCCSPRRAAAEAVEGTAEEEDDARVGADEEDEAEAEAWKGFKLSSLIIRYSLLLRVSTSVRMLCANDKDVTFTLLSK